MTRTTTKELAGGTMVNFRKVDDGGMISRDLKVERDNDEDNDEGVGRGDNGEV